MERGEREVMKRPYTKIIEILEYFNEIGEIIMEVDTSQWTSDKTACDSIRRCIKQKGFKNIGVVKRGERIYLLNYAVVNVKA